MVITQVAALPEQDPDHPVSTDDALGVAVSVTVVPGSKVDPLGAVVITPVPVPVVVVVSSYRCGAKLADTVRASVMVTEHVLAVPVHAPDQPVNTDDALGVAVSVTEVPWSNVVPAGAVVIEPVPDPVVAVVSSYRFRVKVAATARASVMTTVHVVAAPEHAPDHPVNTDEVLGDAVSATDVP